jgi:hypothetical protein
MSYEPVPTHSCLYEAMTSNMKEEKKSKIKIRTRMPATHAKTGPLERQTAYAISNMN